MSTAKSSQSQALSYFHGVASEPLIGRTLSDHLDMMVAVEPERDAVVSVKQSARLSYKEFKEAVDLLARGLLKLGIERGDRVGIWSTNNWQWLVVTFAVARVGAILVNINPGYRTHELEYALNQSGVKLLFVIPQNRSSNYLSMLHELAHHLFRHDTSNDMARVGGLENIVVIGSDLKERLEGKLRTFESVLALGEGVPAKDLAQRTDRVQFDDPVNIQYTSGTTGFPKGVTLSHHNLINNAYLAAKAMGLDANSRFCVPMPFYHCGGMVSSAMAVMSVGGTVVIPSPYFEEEATLEALQSERCTHLSGVPTMYIGQLEHPKFKSYELKSLRGGFMAGAPCPVQLMRRVQDQMNMDQVIILYGLTEVSPLMTATTLEDSLEIRATTVGRAIPGVEVKIIDAVSGEVLPRGTQGEICCRGHGVMLGYWMNPQATTDTIDKSGWLHSGDLAVMNSEGYINITGRKKDMIIRGGENIYPREIEEVLHTHPSIAQAQVFGVPDARLGEEVALWVMLKSGCKEEPQEIVLWLKERVAHFKVPKHVRVVSEFPMTVTGKIQKFIMREKMVEELGLDAEAQIQTA